MRAATALPAPSAPPGPVGQPGAGGERGGRAASSSKDGPSAAGTACTVLVVDDQRSVRQGLRHWLLATGLPIGEVRLAGNLSQAGAQLAGGPVHLVLLDLDLGAENGLDLMPRLPPQTRVLVHSAHGAPAVQQRARSAGACGFVVKGGPAAELLAALRRHLPIGPTPA